MTIRLDYLPFEVSPNKSPRKNNQKPTWIVLHAMAGTYKGSIQWFKNPTSKVSAHYLVSKEGEITCMVKPDLAAWHVKNFNSPSIGIEMEDVPTVKGKANLKLNCLTDPKWCTEAEMKAVAELTATLMLKYKIPLSNVIGHDDPMLKGAPYFNDHRDVGPFFSWVQFRKLVVGFLDGTEKRK